MRRRALPLLLLTGGFFLAASAHGGHEIPFYPSFYPQEIRLETVTAPDAQKRLRDHSLHAYLGSDPLGGGPLPPGMRAGESLRGIIVVTFNTKRAAWRDPARRCGAARGLIGALRARRAPYTFHPYPVTPYHPDFLEHADRIEAARQAHGASIDQDATSLPLRLRAKGPVARLLVGSPEPVGSTDWDATVEDIDLDDLAGSRPFAGDGGQGPPWRKAGWFHAYLLEADSMADPVARRAVDGLYERLQIGRYASATERVGIERTLVARLLEGCDRLAIGYTTRREVYDAEFSAGIENVAGDSHDGFGSAIFVRTVKLKDFPWNGWLRLGAPTRPSSAWNPVGGFSDAASRLVWAAVADPAFFLAPRSGRFLPNRVTVESVASEVPVPPGALAPEPGTGLLREVGKSQTAALRIRYRALASSFHDGSQMTIADLLYPYAFAYRWGASGPAGPDEHDADVEAATALLRDRLVGVQPVRTDTVVRDFGEVKFVYSVPVVDVFLRRASAELPDVAVVAPPWTTVPWHVMVLMEEAVKRGVGAFSASEATRRGVRWLDLVRDRRTTAAMAALLDGLTRQTYVPPALRAIATTAEASARWAALREFYRKHGHFLVTNGPYRLDSGGATGAVLGVFRDLSYPLGVGTFDAWAIPRRAFVTGAEVEGGRLVVRADIEVIEQAMRNYRLVREPLRDRPGGIDKADVPRCRYVVTGAGGEVVRVGTAPFVDPAVFAVDLQGLGPGAYTVAIHLSLGDNDLDPEVKLVQYRVP